MVRKHVIWLNINFFFLAIWGAHSSVDVVVRVSWQHWHRCTNMFWILILCFRMGELSCPWQHVSVCTNDIRTVREIWLPPCWFYWRTINGGWNACVLFYRGSLSSLLHFWCRVRCWDVHVLFSNAPHAPLLVFKVYNSSSLTSYKTLTDEYQTKIVTLFRIIFRVTCSTWR